MASEPSSSKRRKTIHYTSSLGAAVVKNIADLPSEPLIHISSYLAAPSQVLFAVALARYDAESLNNSISSAIVGNHWDTLDFGQIEKELASNLSDEDISAVLQCIDAVNTVKRLRLTNCINITGACLEPLRGSRVIKEIDLSLVGRHQSPLLDPEPPISTHIVLPVLDDIIARGDEAILIQFPKACRQQCSNYFYEFLERQNHTLQIHGELVCKKCDDLSSSEWVRTSSYGGGLGVTNACHECLSHVCLRCRCYINFKFCSGCERFYCGECSKIDGCDSCDKYFCHNCTTFGVCFGYRCEGNIFCGDCQVKCEICNEKSCKDCRVVNSAFLFDCTTCKRTLCYGCICSPTCDSCEIEVCGDCNDKEGADGVAHCDECDKELCIGCRYKDFKTNGSKCSECFGIIGAAFDHIKGLHDNSTQMQIK